MGDRMSIGRRPAGAAVGSRLVRHSRLRRPARILGLATGAFDRQVRGSEGVLRASWYSRRSGGC